MSDLDGWIFDHPQKHKAKAVLQLLPFSAPTLDSSMSLHALFSTVHTTVVSISVHVYT